MLTIQDFIISNQYDIDSLYVDRFLDSISNDKLIYIDDIVLE
jgi:hypothetical protein